MAAETPRRSRTLRYAGRALVILLDVGFVALLAYGLISRSTNTTIDDDLTHSRAASAPSFSLVVLQRGDPGPVLAAKLNGAARDGRVSLRELRATPGAQLLGLLV